MLTTFYDKNGKLYDLEEAKLRSKVRWETIFSNVSIENRSTTKRKQKGQKTNKSSKPVEIENVKTSLFQIPDVLIETNNTEDDNVEKMANEEEALTTSNNQLKVSTKEPAPVDKKLYKLQIGVADFAKKVKDNEGMGISTFSTEDEPDDKNDENEMKRKNLKPTLRTEHFLKMLTIAQEKRKEMLLKKKTPVEKFLHGVRIAMLLMKTCRTSSQETERNNKKFLTFADYQEIDHEKRSSGMFDLKQFKARKESTLGSEAIEIMRINPQMRSKEMIYIAVKAVNSTVEAFSEFPLNMQTSLIQRGWYEKFEAKRTIIRQGHSALNFYFIISGITTVSVARTNKSTGETYMETVAFLKKGNSFGELALMFGGKRSATVSCKSDVELLAVSREDFIDIFMNISSIGEPEHIRFLRSLPLLDQWPLDELPYDDPSICLFTYFRRGTVLCHDSNSGSWVYIVKSGTCRIIKLVLLDPKEQKEEIEHQKNNNHFIEFLTKDSIYGSLNDCRRGIPPPKTKLSKLFNGKFYIQLKILGKGCIFGLEPMAFEFVGGTTGVTFVSDGAELVAIERNFFQRHMTRQYQSWLRKELQPFPTIENLKRKLRNFYKWADYREDLVNSLIFDL